MTNGMTNEEAIEVLEVHKAHWERLLDNGICDVLEGGNTIQALNVAIRALKNERSEQNVGMCQQNVGEISEKQTDGDLISRDYVLSKFNEHCDRCGKYKGHNGEMCRCCELDDAIDYVEEAPSAEKTTINSEETELKLISADGDLISRINSAISATDTDDDYSVGLRNGMRYVISLIDNKEPNFEKTKKSTDGDLISRTDLLNKIFQQAEGRDYYGYNMLNLPYIDLIESMPTITAEPKSVESKNDEKAIEWFQMLKTKFLNTEYAEYLEMAINSINGDVDAYEQGYADGWKERFGEPTAEQKTAEWIPVTERLPKPFTLVNATCRSLVDDREDWVIETLYLPIPKEANKKGYSDWGNIPMLNWGEAEVIAWVERIIPEPYKTEPRKEIPNGKTEIQSEK